MIRILVNSKEYEIEESSSLLDLLTTLQRADDTSMAIAINNKIISKNLWQETVLQSNDKIVIVKAACGG
ncbi:MAG: sulfur carrier protein ThiS [Bacteroidales bacterium]|nr:sulfur carrier protein ThiS [Bacteroidales bacterium]